MPYLVLPSHHYAAKWSQDQEIRETAPVTALGVKFANETDPAKREEMLLELVRYFHGYIFKYVNMILSGALPKNGERINTDAKILLKMFLPAGMHSDGFNLVRIARTLCLAFKGMDAEEVYNILVGCLIRALHQYDPNYTTRVKEVIVAVEKAFSGPTAPASVTFHQVSVEAGFDAMRICRMLVRRGHLARVEDTAGSMTKADWPPQFEDRIIDLPYFVSFYFRHYLQQYITRQMKSLESKTSTMQLEEYKQSRPGDFHGKVSRDDMRIPSAEGNLVEPNGNRWMADTNLMNQDLDLRVLSLDWVSNCKDPVFSKLNKVQRLFLYLVYAKELSKTQVCRAVGISMANYDDFQGQIMNHCRGSALPKAA